MSTPRIIITGINGFVGHHLARELASQNATIIGIGREETATPDLQGIIAEYHSADLIEAWPKVENIDAVIHLAGLAAVGPSFDNPQRYINANSAMVTNMSEYFVKQEKKSRLLVVSSGAVYGSDQAMPITEDSLVGFTSPYAVSKILTENQCAYYRGRGVDCVVVRPFNHIGPGQAPGFIVPDFYKRISELDEGEMAIEVGNIETRRDYTDVRDIARAYTKLVLAPTLRHTLYNVCSGRSISGREILDKLKTSMNRVNITFEVNQALIRPTDVQEIIGDSSRLRDELDWKPEYSIDQTIADFVSQASHQ